MPSCFITSDTLATSDSTLAHTIGLAIGYTSILTKQLNKEISQKSKGNYKNTHKIFSMTIFQMKSYMNSIIYT